MSALACRFCGEPLAEVFADLGSTPLANAFLRAADLDRPEPAFPLCAYVCGKCLLVQIEAFDTPEHIFGEHVYFSSYSDTWVAHARRFAQAAIPALGLGPQSLVVEIASNDGYLLTSFQEQGVPVLGVEPAANVARAAEARGVPTLVRFFGRDLARDLVAQGRRADLLVANNVLAHVPDLNDFVAGMQVLLAPQGTATVEFPHLARLMAETQFDTIYHEHFSYFSLGTAQRVFARHGLAVADVAELPTHGGSLRLHLRHAGTEAGPGLDRVAALLAAESAAGLDRLDAYQGFMDQVRKVQDGVRGFFARCRAAGRTVAGYGAPAKGNTLLNTCGITAADLPYTVDRNPHKQGLFLPGSRVPVAAPERIFAERPDYVFILPWNLRSEIMEQMAGILEWGGRFVAPVPHLTVHPAERP